MGNDTLYATSTVVNLDGGEGDDNLTANGQLNQSGKTYYVQNGVASLQGGAGSDSLRVDNFSSANLEGGDGNDTISAVNDTSASLSGGAGLDNISVLINSGVSQNTDGNARVAKSYLLDGGADNDTLSVTGVDTVIGNGQITVTLNGGTGDDVLTVTDNNAGDVGNNGQSYGITSAILDGGEGNDKLTASGVLQLTLTGGAGVDTFVLTSQQYRTVLEGSRTISNSNSTTTVVNADPLVITDFTAGVGGDLLDYTDLLNSVDINFDGTNPFGNGYLALVQSGTDTLFQFDADGTEGTSSSLVTLVRFQNVLVSAFVGTNFTPNYLLDVVN